MLGYLEDYYLDVLGYSDINIKSFCTTIEIKSHDADGIYRNGTHLMVQYPEGPHDVTIQSEGQKNTLRKFLEGTLQYGERSPFVTNLIWMTGINYEDFDSSVGLINSNILTSDVTVVEIFDAIGRQFRLKDQGFIDSFRNYSENQIGRIADIFCAKSDGVDTMSLRRINILKKEDDILSGLQDKSDHVIVLSGHAGTGKTMMLLKAACVLSKQGKKCLFLTYNTALISDIKHTMTYLPREVENVELKSMHAFMISVLYREKLWDNTKDLERDFLPQMSSLNRNESISYKPDYEYVFVDEAQDWEKPVPSVLKKLFFDSKIVIADGVDQFMRSSEHTNWGNPFCPTLKKSLRQRRNLTVFAKLFAAKMGVSWDVIPNHALQGGTVVVYHRYEKPIHEELLSAAKQHGCSEYDMMLLAPNSLVKNNAFALLEAYKNNGINLFDGINKSKRDTIYAEENKNNRECRVYTYESCRGLEAWTTVCLRFDELFTQPHPHDYKEIEYTMARNYMLMLWTLIPLTRAIDTLVLVVNKDSFISSVLEEIAKETDFVIIKN